MKKPAVFLTVNAVLEIHARSILDFGGTPGVRDQGLLESAVQMPAATFGGHYLHEGLAAMASAYMFHICKNHAFVDGNKRTALASAGIFLLLNGRRLDAAESELHRITLGVADGSIGKAELTKLLRRIVKTWTSAG